MCLHPFFRHLVVLAGLLITPLVHAHEGHGVASHFVAGFLHPFSGIDHLLAMVLVGMWCWAKPRQGWVVPLLFMAGLTLGAWLGMGGVASRTAECLIALSLVALGVLVGRLSRVHDGLWWLSLVAILGFGGVHGYLHGVELQISLNPSHMGLLGMVFASACLHASGWWAGKGLVQRHARLRALTAMASMGTGGWLLAGLFV